MKTEDVKAYQARGTNGVTVIVNALDFHEAAKKAEAIVKRTPTPDGSFQIGVELAQVSFIGVVME